MFPNLADLAAIGQQINEFIVKTNHAIGYIILKVDAIHNRLDQIEAKLNAQKDTE